MSRYIFTIFGKNNRPVMKITLRHLMMISLSALAMACAPKEQVKYLALAFDDGPNATTESKMLDVLAKHNVPATFFVIGKNINEESAENMKRALELGCEIGNHSLTHRRQARDVRLDRPDLHLRKGL